MSGLLYCRMRLCGAEDAPTRQGVFGITRTTRALSWQAASMSASVTPAAIDTTRWRGCRQGASWASSGFTPYGFVHTNSTSARSAT